MSPWGRISTDNYSPEETFDGGGLIIAHRQTVPKVNIAYQNVRIATLLIWLLIALCIRVCLYVWRADRSDLNICYVFSRLHCIKRRNVCVCACVWCCSKTVAAKLRCFKRRRLVCSHRRGIRRVIHRRRRILRRLHHKFLVCKTCVWYTL